MLAAMIEDGPDAFTKRWGAYAGQATLFARPEGSPLLEAGLGPTVVQLLERTNPYLAAPGPARLLVNPTATRLERLTAPRTELSVPTRGALAGAGEVLERDGRIAVVDAGWPLVVALPDGDAEAEVGAFVAFEAEAPIHGFVLPPERRAAQAGGREVDEAH
jgi:hypothetical protein